MVRLDELDDYICTIWEINHDSILCTGDMIDLEYYELEDLIDMVLEEGGDCYELEFERA